MVFPYMTHLLAAMLLGALIGAERQWRQRMAGLRTNALVATGAAVFILSAMSASPDSPGRIAAQIVSGIGVNHRVPQLADKSTHLSIERTVCT